MNKVKTNSQSYLGPFITMVILMSLVGLITSINQQFQAPMQAAYLRQAGDLENTLATLINFSFFLAYLVMGNVAAKAIDKWVIGCTNSRISYFISRVLSI